MKNIDKLLQDRNSWEARFLLKVQISFNSEAKCAIKWMGLMEGFYPIFTVNRQRYAARRLYWAIQHNEDPGSECVVWDCPTGDPRCLEHLRKEKKQPPTKRGKHLPSNKVREAKRPTGHRSSLVESEEATLDALLPPPAGSEAAVWYDTFKLDPSLSNWLFLLSSRGMKTDTPPPFFVWWTEDEYERKRMNRANPQPQEAGDLWERENLER